MSDKFTLADFHRVNPQLQQRNKAKRRQGNAVTAKKALNDPTAFAQPILSEVYYSISDIHGMYDKLEKLIALVKEDSYSYTKKSLVFLGDFIDRGDDSKKVISTLIRGFPGFNVTYLKGNHEALAQVSLAPSAPEHLLKVWLSKGGDTTLKSYGISIKGKSYKETQQEVKENVSLQNHLLWMSNLPKMLNTTHFLFVHAGINPEASLFKQKTGDADLETGVMHIRSPDSFKAKLAGNKVIVHGHTSTVRIQGHKGSFKDPNVTPHRIGIDTGAVHGGKLTCAVLAPNRPPRFLQV